MVGKKIFLEKKIFFWYIKVFFSKKIFLFFQIKKKKAKNEEKQKNMFFKKKNFFFFKLKKTKANK